MELKQTYTEEEAQQILLRSMARQDQMQGAPADARRAVLASAGVTPDQLAAMAAELGVSVEALRAAEVEWRANHAEQEDRAAFQAHRRAEWRSHIVSYIGVNTFLMLINLVTEHRISWAVFPLLGWGLAMFFHTMALFQSEGEEYEKEFEKWRERRQRKGDAGRE